MLSPVTELAEPAPAAAPGSGWGCGGGGGGGDQVIHWQIGKELQDNHNNKATLVDKYNTIDLLPLPLLRSRCSHSIVGPHHHMIRFVIDKLL